MPDEWAKTTGKGIDAARELGSFLAPIVRAPLENAMGIVADKLAYMRWERQQRLMMRATEFMLAQGLTQPTRSVPLNIAIPLMQAASMEEDNVLQDIWAKLLVNAIDADSGVDVRRCFVSILEELSSLEVLILDMLYAATRVERYATFRTFGLPEELISTNIQVQSQAATKIADDVHLALWNLVRHSCVSSLSLGQEQVYVISLTVLGESLVQACTLRPKL